MRAHIQKWGNNLGLRIPKALAADLDLAEGTRVELSVENGRLIVALQRETKYNVVELVATITPENLHSETDTGLPIGREAW